MLREGVIVCGSGNKPNGMDSTNTPSKIVEVVSADATSVNGSSKNVLNIERMSPASVDSGFDSSFSSSPDCSLDSSVVGAEMTKCCKDSKFKRRRKIVAVAPQCPLSVCQPSCSTLSSSISRTSGGISIFSSNNLINTDAKADENFCLDACLLEKRASASSLSSPLQRVTEVPIIQDSGVTSTGRLGCSAAPSSSGNISSEGSELTSSVRCHWKSCTEWFACDNDLYDHVVKAHLELLRPSMCLDRNSNNGSSGGGGSESQTIGRLKNLMCQWGSCKMGLIRGDFQKRFLWLEEHFTTRHAGKAQPYMCLIEGCSLRFTMKRSLEEHLRTGHDKVKAKRPHTEGSELSRIKSCYQWTPLPYYIPSEKNDFLDHATEEWIVMRLRQYERTNGACFIPREPITPRGGAAYRKRRRLLTFSIEPLKIIPKVIADTMELADAKLLMRNAFIGAKNCAHSVSRIIADSS